MGIPEVEAGWKEITDPSREVNWTASTEGLRDHLWRRVGAGSCAPGLQGVSGEGFLHPGFTEPPCPSISVQVSSIRAVSRDGCAPGAPGDHQVQRMGTHGKARKESVYLKRLFL